MSYQSPMRKFSPLIVLFLMGCESSDAPGHILLDPFHFSDGIETLKLEQVKKNEQIAVIAVHATQSPFIREMNYSLSVEGLDSNAPDTLSWRAKEITKDEPFRRLRSNHIDWVSKHHEASQTICAPPYQIGKLCDFWIFQNGTSLTQIGTKLVWVSSGALWFIDNDDLDLTEAELTDLADQFENVAIPANQDHFGSIPDTDSNQKIAIVLTSKLLDVESMTGLPAYVAPMDLLPNSGDIIYALHPEIFVKLGYSREDYFRRLMPGTLVHELKHLVSNEQRLSQGRPLEELWIEEPSAVAAEEIAREYADRAQTLAFYGTESGFPQTLAKSVFGNLRNLRIVHESRPKSASENLGLYTLNFLFFWNTYSSSEEGFLSTWLKGPANGVQNLQFHAGADMSELMTDFALELYLSQEKLRNQSWPALQQDDLRNGDYSTRGISIHLANGMGKDATLTLHSSYAEKPYFWILREKIGEEID